MSEHPTCRPKPWRRLNRPNKSLKKFVDLFSEEHNNMISIKGIYEKGNIRPEEEIPFKGRKNVIITFLENDEHSEVREMTLNAPHMEFWTDPREDIYNDLDPKNENR